jgi:hypothetical protein
MNMRIVVFAAQVAVCLVPASAVAQQDSTLARVRSLSVDSLLAPTPTYFSPGYRARAESLQTLLRRASDYFAPRLGIKATVWLVVLDEEGWKGLRRRGPYGAYYGSPFSSPPPRVIGVPALPESSVVTKVMRSVRTNIPSDGLDTLRRILRSYDDAALATVDWFSLHEFGHALADTWGARSEARWLHEFLATYLASAFLADNDPNALAAWNVVSRALIDGTAPAARGLDDFNGRLVGGSIETYGWFQSQFVILASEILRHRGNTDLFSRMRASGLDVGTASVPTAELLGRLEQIVPGFQRWAAALSGPRPP